MATLTSDYFETIRSDCRQKTWHDVWFVFDLLVLTLGVVANTAVLCLLLSERKSMSSSQVLGVNIVVMDLMFLSITPVDLLFDSNPADNSTRSASVNIPHKHAKNVAKNFFSMFNLIGCPMLLACMCIERYMAVIKPVLYLRMKNWGLRMAVSAGVWLLTLAFCMGAGVTNNTPIFMVPVSIIISWLFIIMLACLWRVVRSLWQKSPAHTTQRKHKHSDSPLKRRAVSNVLAVVVPAVLSYLPVLVMMPIVLYMVSFGNTEDNIMCEVIELSMLFPRFGVFIGPLFYLSKAKQICWNRK